MEQRPRVSIGMPVRNGERYIRQAVDSLLAQIYADFELIICDNCSSDATEQICRAYATADPRVRYVRNETNLGPSANFNKTFELSRGEYFRWHAHDDMCRPEHLGNCVAALDADAGLVVAYPGTLVVDQDGKPLENYIFHPQTNSPDPVRRFAELVLVRHRHHRAVEIFGLMRSSALRQTPLQGCYARGDSVLLVRMALLGRFVELPEQLFLSRSHATQSMQTLPGSPQANQRWLARVLGPGPLPPPEWWDSSRRGMVNFPEWNLMREYWRSIGPSPLNASHKLGCRAVMLWWILRNTPKLMRDVIYAVENLLYRMVGKRLA